VGDNRGLHPVAHAQLGKDATDEGLDRRLAHEQPSTNLGVAQPWVLPVTRPACQKSARSYASRHRAASLDLVPLETLSCDIVVQSAGGWGSVLWPRSLHTAEATGSKPVTPTRANSPLNPRIHPHCQQSVRIE
jgi:hypothetical protein